MRDDNDVNPLNGNDDEEDNGTVEFFAEEDLGEEEFDDEDLFDDEELLDELEAYDDPVQRSLEVVDTNIDKFLSVSNADAVYGVPVEHGESLIIPAAEVLSGMGFGVGYGGGEAPEQEEGKTQGGEGGGGGGGGYAFSRPVAVIIADPNGVRVEPVVDVTKIALTALTAFGFMIATIGRMRRGRL